VVSAALNLLLIVASGSVFTHSHRILAHHRRQLVFRDFLACFVVATFRDSIDAQPHAVGVGAGVSVSKVAATGAVIGPPVKIPSLRDVSVSVAMLVPTPTMSVLALKTLQTAQCPFKNLPEKRASRWGESLTAEKMNQCRWVKPKLVCQIAFVEWTTPDTCGIAPLSPRAMTRGRRRSSAKLEVTRLNCDNYTE
jgi:hypothetical protein